MTTKVIMGSGDITPRVNTANTTLYAPLGGSPATGGAGVTETRQRMIIREVGTFSNLYVRLTANSCSGTTTYTMRDNAVTKTETVSFTTAQTGEQEDIVNSDVTTAGHFYDIIIVPAGGSTGTNTISITRLLYSTTTNTASRFYSRSVVSLNQVSTTFYNAFGGIGGQGTTDIFRCRQRKAGTIQNMYINVFSNTRTTTTTMNGRLSGSNATLTIPVTTLQTGYLEDTSHSDNVAVGDDYDITFVTGSDSNTIAIDGFGVSFVSTAGYMQLVASSSVTGSKSSTTSQCYYPLSGYIETGNIANTTESDTQTKAGSTLLFSQMTIVISTNTGATSTLVFRKNTGNGNQAISIGSSATGVFTDTVNMDGVVASDEVNYGFTAGTVNVTAIATISSWALPGVIMTETTAISSTSPRKVSRKIPVAISL